MVFHPNLSGTLPCIVSLSPKRAVFNGTRYVLSIRTENAIWLRFLLPAVGVTFFTS